jgi:hypothetical protein
MKPCTLDQFPIEIAEEIIAQLDLLDVAAVYQCMPVPYLTDLICQKMRARTTADRLEAFWKMVNDDCLLGLGIHILQHSGFPGDYNLLAHAIWSEWHLITRLLLVGLQGQRAQTMAAASYKAGITLSNSYLEHF